MTDQITQEWKEKIDKAIAAAQAKADRTDQIVEIFVDEEYICSIHPNHGHLTSSGWLPREYNE